MKLQDLTTVELRSLKEDIEHILRHRRRALQLQLEKAKEVVIAKNTRRMTLQEAVGRYALKPAPTPEPGTLPPTTCSRCYEDFAHNTHYFDSSRGVCIPCLTHDASKGDHK